MSTFSSKWKHGKLVAAVRVQLSKNTRDLTQDTNATAMRKLPNNLGDQELNPFAGFIAVIVHDSDWIRLK